MRPPIFDPQPLPDREGFVRDATDGQVYHRCSTRVLYADTDRSSVVYHANYLRYYEQGRASLMRAVGYPYAAVEKAGFIYPIIDMRVQFMTPLHYDDPVLIHTRPTERDRVRVRFDYVLTHGDSGALVCRGYTQHCAANPRGVPVAVDPETVAVWEDFPR